VASEPDKFRMPSRSDMRYNWVDLRLAALDEADPHDLVIDAWRMVVPKRVAAAFLEERLGEKIGRSGQPGQVPSESRGRRDM
jgi:hypothetical protein